MLCEQLVGSDAPFFVGNDGHSGAGKSTLAAAVTTDFSDPRDNHDRVTVIDGDDFYTGGSAVLWDGRTTAENVDQVINWQATERDSEVVPLTLAPTLARAAPLIVLQGTYSCRSEWALRWSKAEDYHFSRIMRPEHFDIVLDTA